ncbi:MAG: S8/S53 family peptidase [Candidatus Thermoplasmatota archaeon]|nr:S8/S53 family peptidase [Candidatus Thermoplasmatota archaeon]
MSSRHYPLFLALLLLCSSLSGCFGNEKEVVEEIEPEEAFGAYSVVAPIDTGINVYHDRFILNETLPDWLLDGLGVTMWCNLTQNGTWQERYDADASTCWDIITANDIVYFPGTRIIGTTPDDDTNIPILDDPSDGHGTAVTGAVLDANPDAIIFFVEGFSDAAVLAAANQPLVDIITTSFGPIGSVPVPGIEDATRVAVVEHNKVHTGASDNTPSPAVQDSTAGPPWSIGISGYAEEDDDQKETMSGSYPDIAADWTQVLPNHDDTDGYHETSGTSFATPRTAGILSLVLTQLRELGGDMGSGASEERGGYLVNGTNLSISNSQLRDALNLSAWYPSFSSWNPTSGTMPISPVAPCTQVGWGVVNMSNVEPLYEHLADIETMPSRPADVVACMEANQDIREAYWGE